MCCNLNPVLSWMVYLISVFWFHEMFCWFSEWSRPSTPLREYWLYSKWPVCCVSSFSGRDIIPFRIWPGLSLSTDSKRKDLETYMTNPGSHSQGCSCLPNVLWGLDKYPQLSTSFQPTSNWEAGCLPGWHGVDAVMPSMGPRLLWALHCSWPNDR